MSRVTAVIGSIAPGTKAVCDMITQNPELGPLMGESHPPRTVFASGTVTASAFGLNNVPGCQTAISRDSNHGVVAWAVCHYKDPIGFGDTRHPVPGTTNVYLMTQSLAHGVLVIPDSTTALIMGTLPGSTAGQSVMVKAAQDANGIFQKAGGCASS